MRTSYLCWSRSLYNGRRSVNYPSSRINSAYTGDYDKMVDLRSLRIAPGIAVAFNDKLSFGATGNIAIQGLRTNLATSTLTSLPGLILRQRAAESGICAWRWLYTGASL